MSLFSSLVLVLFVRFIFSSFRSRVKPGKDPASDET
jgi:hypothetical protein